MRIACARTLLAVPGLHKKQNNLSTASASEIMNEAKSRCDSRGPFGAAARLQAPSTGI